MILLSVKHLFKPSYFDTIDELVEAYTPMIEWLSENIKGSYKLSPMDNAAYSDMNEDPWIGYVISFGEETDVITFKLRWL